MSLTQELNDRFLRFKTQLTKTDPGWEAVAIFSKINLFYFTNTMQNGVLIIKREGAPVFFVRRSYERARIESPLAQIYQIRSFKDILQYMSLDTNSIHIEKDTLPIGFFERFNKVFGIKHIFSADAAILKTRAVKSNYELDLMKKSGKIHEEVMQKIIPLFLKPGLSEAEIGGLILCEMIRRGGQGITRMGTFNAELYGGNVSFGESGNYFNSFDGPVGVMGISPAVPMLGNLNKIFDKITR